MTQQYSTPDGSVWVKVTDRVTYELKFQRIDSPDNSHEMDFRDQRLEEVLASWGSLSLHDPLAPQIEMLNKALSANGGVMRAELPAEMAKWLDKVGWELKKKES